MANHCTSRTDGQFPALQEMTNDAVSMICGLAAGPMQRFAGVVLVVPVLQCSRDFHDRRIEVVQNRRNRNRLTSSRVVRQNVVGRCVASVQFRVCRRIRPLYVTPNAVRFARWCAHIWFATRRKLRRPRIVIGPCIVTTHQYLPPKHRKPTVRTTHVHSGLGSG